MVKFLFEHGADICANNNQAICWASLNGHIEVVKFLVENGADICAQDNLAICWAAENGHTEVVKFLVENGADIYARNDSVICLASENGHSKVVKFLLSFYENDVNLIYLLNDIYKLNLDCNVNLVNKISILIWSIKLDKYIYFKYHFNEEDEIYDFIFNYKFDNKFNEFDKFIYIKKHLKNKYLNLETICLQ